MKKVLKWLLILIAGFALLLLALVIVLPLVFDPNEQKQQIEDAVAAASGRSFEIQGEIQWRIFPQLGFSAGPLLLGNAPGFESTHFARLGKVDVSVQLMPLFERKIEIGEITISELELELEVNAAGLDNWSDFAADRTAAKSEPVVADNSDAPGFQLQGIKLSDGLIRYTDQQAGFAVEISELSLLTSALQSGRPLEAMLGMSVTSEFWPGPMTVKIELAVDDPLGNAPGHLQVQTLSVEGILGEGLPLAFELVKPVEIDPDSGVLQIEQWKLTAGPAELRGNLQVLAGEQGAMRLSGRIDVPSFDGRAMLAAFTGKPLQLANPNSLARIGGGANWKLAGDSALLSDLVIALDDSKISGQLELSSISSLTGVADFKIDQIDLDRYMAVDVEAQSGPGPSDSDSVSIPSSSLTADLTIGQLKVAGIAAENVSLRFRSTAGKLRIFPIKADLYQGHMNGGITLHTGVNGKLVVRNTLKGISAAPLLTDLIGQALISGTGKLVIDLTFSDPLAANPWKSANGKLEFRFRDGAIHGVDVLGIMRQAASLLDLGSQQFRNQDPSTDFSSLRISAVIDQGVLSTPTMTLQSPYLRVTGDGSINLADNTLDYTIRPVLVSTPAGQGGLSLEKLKGIKIPITLTGTLDQPKWRIDPTALLLAGQQGMLGKKAARLLQAVAGNGEEEAVDSKDSGINLLKALFKEATKREPKKQTEKPEN